MEDCLIKNAVNFSLNKLKNKIIQLGTVFYNEMCTNLDFELKRALFIRNCLIGRKRKKKEMTICNNARIIEIIAKISYRLKSNPSSSNFKCVSSCCIISRRSLEK
ncbi:hypothetical protein ACKWTF_007347 [Chironomus riparius]